jgi:hypothetical protein
MRDPYPLQWPEGWPRAKFRRRPKFGTRFVEDRDAVIRYLRKRGGSNIAITSNLPVNSKGLPYEAGVIGGGGDTGVAVWWVEKGREQVIACDAWMRAAENLSAIERTLTALRALDRYGCTSVVERAFAGFAALPPGTDSEFIPPQPTTKRPWREVIGGAWPELDPSELLVIARARHRTLIAEHHPDRGGDTTVAAELNAAMDDAERELGKEQR